MTALVWIVAALQFAAVGLFAMLSLSGDAWGIARGMAMLLALPLVVMTLPALALLRFGFPWAAGAVASTSLLASVILWRLA